MHRYLGLRALNMSPCIKLSSGLNTAGLAHNNKHDFCYYCGAVPQFVGCIKSDENAGLCTLGTWTHSGPSSMLMMLHCPTQSNRYLKTKCKTGPIGLKLKLGKTDYFKLGPLTNHTFKINEQDLVNTTKCKYLGCWSPPK